MIAQDTDQAAQVVGDAEKKKNENGIDKQGEETFSNVNKKGGSGCWNCGHKDYCTYQCPKLSAEEQAELSRDGGPNLLNAASFEDAIYTTEDKYNGVAFVSPVMVQSRTLTPHYLYLDSCSAFNQVFTENHISDLQQVRISLRAGCNTRTSMSNEKGMILGAIKTWLVRTGIVNLASIPQME